MAHTGAKTRRAAKVYDMKLKDAYAGIDYWCREAKRKWYRRNTSPYHRKWIRHCLKQIRYFDKAADNVE